MKHLKKIILAFIGMLIFIYILRFINMGELKNVFSRVNPWLLALVVALDFVMIIFCVLRWQCLMKSIKLKSSFVKSYIMYTISLGIGFLTPGKLGDFSRGFLIDKTHDSKKKAGSITGLSFVAQERIMDLVLMVVFVLLSILVFGQKFRSFNIALGTSIMTGLIVIFLILLCLFNRVRERIRTRKKWLKRLLDYLSIFSKSFIDILHRPGLLFQVFLTSLLIWFFRFLQVYVLLAAFGIRASYLEAIALSSVSLFLGIVSMIPIGLGIEDASIVYLLSVMGVARELGAVIAVGYRIFVSLPIILAGAILSAVYLKKKH